MPAPGLKFNFAPSFFPNDGVFIFIFFSFSKIFLGFAFSASSLFTFSEMGAVVSVAGLIISGVVLTSSVFCTVGSCVGAIVFSEGVSIFSTCSVAVGCCKFCFSFSFCACTSSNHFSRIGIASSKFGVPDDEIFCFPSIYNLPTQFFDFNSPLYLSCLT